MAPHRTSFAPRLPGPAGPVDRAEYAEGEAPGVDQAGVARDRALVYAHLVHAGETEAQALRHRGFHGRVQIVLADRRDQVADEPHRLVDQHTRGVAGGVAQDAAAGWIGRGIVDAGGM